MARATSPASSRSASTNAPSSRPEPSRPKTSRRATRHGRRDRARPVTRSVDPILLVAAGLGLLVSAYLAFVDLAGGSTVCLVGSDCDVVRASAYGRVVGLPVAVLGISYFALVLALTLPIPGLSRASWRPALLDLLGGLGLGAAVLFVGIQAFILRAWCPYCLVADAAALTIAVRTLRSRPAGALGRAALGSALAAAVLLGGYAISPPATAATTPATEARGGDLSSTVVPFDATRLAALADHLRESGAVFYGAYWCPHCQNQKQTFGEAASRLPYVECDPRGTNARPDLCQAAGVRVYPTWVIDGQRIEGEVSPRELARRSGFGG